jgi:hypothetical protein
VRLLHQLTLPLALNHSLDVISGQPAKEALGNGINVQATNTVEGDSAVATSNIEMKPVQIINCPPEVEEKQVAIEYFTIIPHLAYLHYVSPL